MAAAASPNSTTGAVSPELALVDAVLAADLRTTLDIPVAVTEVKREDEGASVESRARHLDPNVQDAGQPEEAATAEVLYLALESPDHVDASDLIVEPADDHVDIASVPATVQTDLADSVVAISWPEAAEDEVDNAVHVSYPTLPAPTEAGSDSMDAAEAVLRDIRDRLATPAPSARRRFRTRFTIASSVSALCALGALVIDVYLGAVPV